MGASVGRGLSMVGEGEREGSGGRWEGGVQMVIVSAKQGRMKRSEFETMQSII